MRISSVAEMESAGETFAQQLQAGDVISLQGELGAGKTAFTRGVGRGLGVSDQISSPTFVIARSHHGRCTFTHVDLYRLLDHDNVVDEVIDLDFDTSGNINVKTSGGGISFNNASAISGATLNDYETGTWTPAIDSLTP